MTNYPTYCNSIKITCYENESACCTHTHTLLRSSLILGHEVEDLSNKNPKNNTKVASYLVIEDDRFYAKETSGSRVSPTTHTHHKKTLISH